MKSQTKKIALLMSLFTSISPLYGMHQKTFKYILNAAKGANIVLANAYCAYESQRMLKTYLL